MIRANKKGWIGILTVAVLGVIITAVIATYGSGVDVVETMGQKQAALLRAYSTGEAMREFIKGSAKLAAQQAIYSLGIKGGFNYPDVDCSIAASGAVIWSGTCADPVAELKNTALEYEFLWYLEQRLEAFELPSYEMDDITNLYDVLGETGSYNLAFDAGTNNQLAITGYPVITQDEEPVEDINGEPVEDINGEPITQTVVRESVIIQASETYNYAYVIDPYFNVETGVDITAAFKEVKAAVDVLDLSKCNSDPDGCKGDLEDSTPQFTWEVTSDGTDVTFTATASNTALLIGQGSSIQKVPFVIKFAKPL